AGHRHLHGVTDPAIVTTTRGMGSLKWSCMGLLVTAGFQLVVVALSGSVALLADTIHNFGDAATALPLWVAFALARRRPTERFTYGFGRLEDLAGMAIVLIRWHISGPWRWHPSSAFWVTRRWPSFASRWDRPSAARRSSPMAIMRGWMGGRVWRC